MSTPAKPSGLSVGKKIGIGALTIGAISSAAVVPACKEKVAGKYHDIMASEDKPLSRGKLADREESEGINSEQTKSLLKNMLKAVENTRSSHDSDAVSAFDQLHEEIRSSAEGLGDHNQLSCIIDDGAGNGVSYSMNAVDKDKITIKYRGFGNIDVDHSFTLVKHETNKTVYVQDPNGEKSKKVKISWDEIREAIKKMIPLESASYSIDPKTGYYTLSKGFLEEFNKIS